MQVSPIADMIPYKFGQYALSELNGRACLLTKLFPQHYSTPIECAKIKIKGVHHTTSFVHDNNHTCLLIARATMCVWSNAF